MHGKKELPIENSPQMVPMIIDIIITTVGHKTSSHVSQEYIFLWVLTHCILHLGGGDNAF